MADDKEMPGQKAKVKYRILQFASGEWAVERSEIKCVAWFPSYDAAREIMAAMLPLNAEREY